MDKDDFTYHWCANHPDQPARWICFQCGCIFCEECVEPAGNEYYCRDCFQELETTTDAAEGTVSVSSKSHHDANPVKRLLAFGSDFIFSLIVSLFLTALLRIIVTASPALTNTFFYFLLYLCLLLRDLLTAAGSPGKYMTNLYLRDLKGKGKPGPSARLLRNVLFPVFYLDLLTVPFTGKMQRLGELLTATTVCDAEYPVDERKYIYRAAAVVGALLIAMFSTFAYWFSGEIRQRTRVEHVIQESEDGEVYLGEGVERKLQAAEDLRVVKTAEDTYRVTAEFPTSEKYYDGRRKIDKIMSRLDYAVVEDEGPQVILRGDAQPGYRLEVTLKKIDG